MVAVLIIPDGAAEPLRHGELTSLERARTPALDALATRGSVARVVTTPPGLAPGSETGIPTLLGASPTAAVDRAAIEAAAYGIAVPAGSHAWRVDAERGSTLDAFPDHDLHHLRGHRYLAVGTATPEAPVVWPRGSALPQMLDARTVVVAARGAASGCARLMGATVITPAGATGDGATAWAAKREAAITALASADRVVVHAGAPDEAAHERDPAAKVAAIEAVDRELVGPLWAALAGRGVLTVCPDHGTDPRTGNHDAAPVPCAEAGPGVMRDAARRMTERAIIGVAPRALAYGRSAAERAA